MNKELGLKLKIVSDTTQVRADLGDLERQMRMTGSAGATAFQPAARGADEFERRVRGGSSALQNLALGGAAIGGLTAGFSALQAVASSVIGTFSAFAGAIMSAQAQADRLSLSLKFSTGAAAGESLEYVRRTAAALGLDLQSAAGAYAKLAAAAKGTALEGQQTRAVFESVASAGAVMGLSASEMEGALLAVSQMISKGTVSAEELRGQLGERLPGAFQIAARAMGVTTGELGKMLEAGQLMADDFLPKFAAQIKSELGDSVDQASKTATAATNRLSTAWTDAQAAFAGSGVSAFIGEQLNILSDGLNDFSSSVRQAKAEGDGFWGQMFAGSAALVRFANPINAISYEMQSLGNELAQSELRLRELEAQLERQPNNLMLRQAKADAAGLVDELRQAKALADAYSDPSRREDVQVATDPVAVAAKQRADSIARANKVIDEANAANTRLATQLGALADAYNSGGIDLARYRMGVSLLVKEQKSADSAAKALDDKYGRLRDSAELALNEALSLSDGTGKLTSSQRKLAEIASQVERGEVKLAVLQKNGTIASLSRAAAIEIEVDERKALNEALKEHERQVTSMLTSEERSLDAIKKQVEQAQLELEKIGLTDEGLARLEIKRIDDAIAIEEERLALALKFGEDEREIDLIAQKIRELEKLKSVRSAAYSKEAEARAAEAVNATAKQWADWREREHDQLSQSIYDALVSGGRSALDVLVDAAKATVLKPIIMPIAQGLSGLLMSLLGGNAYAGTAAAGGGGGFGLGSLFGSGGLFQNFAGNAAFGFNDLGQFIFNNGFQGSGSWLMENAIDLGDFADIGGSALSYGNAIMAAMDGRWGSAAGQALGTWFGGPIGGWVGSTLGSMLDKAFGGETRGGGQYAYDFGNGSYNARRGTWLQGSTPGVNLLEGPSGGEIGGSAVRDSIEATVGTINGLLEAMGSGARLSGFQAGLETSGDGKGGVFSGGTLNSGTTFGESGQGDNYAGTLFEGGGGNYTADEALQAFALDLQQVTIQALQAATDLPSAIAEQIKDIDAEALTAEEAQAIIQSIVSQVSAANAVGKALGPLGGVFDQLASSSLDTRLAVLELTGGLDALVQQSQSYFSEFYSTAEQMDIRRQSMYDALADVGIDASTLHTREEFRALVDSLDLSTESGREMFAALMSVSGEFATLADYYAEQTDALQEQADAASRARDELNATTRSLIPFGGVFGQLRNMSEASRQALAGLVGGIDALSESASSYVANFYTEKEQAQISAKGIQQTLQAAGINTRGLDSREDFRRIVDSLDLSTEAGRTQFAALMSVQQDFAELLDYLNENRTSIDALARRAPSTTGATDAASNTSTTAATTQTPTADGSTQTSAGTSGSTTTGSTSSTTTADTQAAMSANLEKTATTLADLLTEEKQQSSAVTDGLRDVVAAITAMAASLTTELRTAPYERGGKEAVYA